MSAQQKYLWGYALWIGVTSGVYLFIYLMTPLGRYGLAWMTFVALPIYFMAGAPLDKIPHYTASMLAGLFWGWLNLLIIAFLMAHGCNAATANLIDMVLVTVPVGLHLTVFSKTWLNVIPMVFGGLALTFSQGGKNIPVIGITMFLGILLGAVYHLGGNFLEKHYLGE